MVRREQQHERLCLTSAMAVVDTEELNETDGCCLLSGCSGKEEQCKGSNSAA